MNKVDETCRKHEGVVKCLQNFGRKV